MEEVIIVFFIILFSFPILTLTISIIYEERYKLRPFKKIKKGEWGKYYKRYWMDDKDK